MASQDILFIVLAVCSVFISVPLILVLWRVYTMMERIEKLLAYADHVRGLALKFEDMPLKFIDGLVSSLVGKKK